MARHQLVRIVVAGLIPMLAAAGDAVSTATATGKATLKCRPEIIRCKLVLTGDGKTVQEAVESLVKHRDDVKQKLTAAGAEADSVQSTEPIIGTPGITDQMRRMSSFNGRARPAPATQPTTYTVSCLMQADWQLNASSAEDALVKSAAAEDKIRAAVPKANPAAVVKQLTPEEREIAEEMAAAQSNTAENATAKPDEPQFVFVHKLTEDDRAKLAADAFTAAHADAQRIATAAKRSLGPLKDVTVGPSTDAASNPYAAYIEAMTEVVEPKASDAEMTGAQASSVSKTLTISASFVLQ